MLRPTACRRKRWRISWRGRLTRAKPCAPAVERRRAGVTAALEISTSFLRRCSCTWWWRWRESPERAWQPPQRSTRVCGSWTQQSCFTLFSQCGSKRMANPATRRTGMLAPLVTCTIGSPFSPACTPRQSSCWTMLDGLQTKVYQQTREGGGVLCSQYPVNRRPVHVAQRGESWRCLTVGAQGARMRDLRHAQCGLASALHPAALHGLHAGAGACGD